MANSIMYKEEMFVLLTDQEPEVFLTPTEMANKLAIILQDYSLPLPKTLEKLPTLAEKAEHLRDNYCELDQANGGYLQWYAVRLEK